MTQNQRPGGASYPEDPNQPVGAAAHPDDPAQISKIEADIDQTRSAISGDLRTLGERLSPQHLKEEAKEVMTEAKNVAVETLHEAKNVATSTYREVKDDAVGMVSAKVDELRDNVRSVEHEAVSLVRENAVPLALIGIGVAWFVSNRRRRDAEWGRGYTPRGQGNWRYPPQRGSHPLDDARENVSHAADRTRELGYRARDRARNWAEGAERGVGQVAGQVRDFAEREVGEVRGAARDVRDRLGRTTARARDVAERELRQAGEFSRRTTNSHPLAVAAGAVAAGVLVGYALPETERESELLGPQRERLFSDAKEALGEVQEAFGDAKNAAKETARGVKNSLSGSAG